MPLMNTKSCFTPTKKYKTLISAVHGIYRLVNSTFELKDMVCRLSRLICQVFNARYCMVVVLDGTKRYSLVKCMVSGKRRMIVVDHKKKITSLS